MSGCKVGKVWEIKNKIIGVKKTPSEPTAIINPKSGKMALTKSEIKKVSLEYTKETLESNEIQEAVAEEIERKRSAMEIFHLVYLSSRRLVHGTWDKWALGVL